MRLTRAGEYGVRCMLYLSALGPGQLGNRKEIARKMEIPDQFLGKIAQQLAKNGLIEIVQGAKGGYRLLVSPQKLTLLNVVEAVVGEIFLNDCILRPEACSRSQTCAVHRVWEKARDRLRDTLQKATFDQLLQEHCATEPGITDQQTKTAD